MRDYVLRRFLIILISGSLVYPITQAQRPDYTIYNSISSLMTDFTLPQSLIYVPLPDGSISGMGFEIDGDFFIVWYNGKRVLPESENFKKVMEAHNNHLDRFTHMLPRHDYVLVKERTGKTKLQEQMTLSTFSYMEDVLIPYKGKGLFSNLLKKELEQDGLIPKGKNKLDLIFRKKSFKIDNAVQSEDIFIKYKNLYEKHYEQIIRENSKIEITLELKKPVYDNP